MVAIRTVFIALILFQVALPLSAQSTKVELSGLVTDPGGLPVPGAEVRLQNMSTDAEQSTSSGANGQYHFVAVPPGTYTVTAMKQGFAATRREGLTLRVGDQITVDIPLQVGTVEQSVTVTDAAPLLQATRGTVSLTV